MREPRAQAMRGDPALGYGPPTSFEELKAVLSSSAMRLPKRLRAVAVYLGQQPTEVALGTTASVAARCGVPPSTLVRFAQTFGFKGFTELQALFKSHVKGTAHDRMLDNSPGGHDGNLLQGCLGAGRASLTRTAVLDAARLGRAADVLAKADVIHLLGSKRAFPAAAYLAVAYTRLGLRNVLVAHVGGSAVDELAWAGAADAVLALSFSPYNSQTPELAAEAAGRGVPVVAITDSPLSPLVPVAAVWLEVIEDEFAGFRSPAATIAVGLALGLAVGARRQERLPPTREIPGIEGRDVTRERPTRLS